MKKILYLFVLLLFAPAGFGQKVNFSGNWKINREKSQLGEEFSMAPNYIIVERGKNSLSVERHSSWQGEEFSFTDKFTLDGKECENPGWMDSIKKSTAVWAEKKLLKITTKIPMQDGGEMTIVDEYTLVDGNLNIKTFASSSYGEMTEVYVFEKQ
jgi:hypothetical protein